MNKNKCLESKNLALAFCLEATSQQIRYRKVAKTVVRGPLESYHLDHVEQQPTSQLAAKA